MTNIMNPSKLEALIHETLEEFYRQRIKKLVTVKLKDVLGYKNLYLLCATGTQSCGVIVQEMLRSYMSTFDESIFSDAFLESVARIASEEIKSSIESDGAYKAIALIDLMRKDPTLSWVEFEEKWTNATNRLTYDFVNNFCKADFSIDWEKLLRFNSGKDKIPWISKLVPVISTEDQDDSSDDTDDVDSDEEALDE